MVKLLSLTIAAIALLAFHAHAHYFWLERDGNGPVRAYYGEWTEDIRENTGGLLDRFKTPRATIGASSETISPTRNANNLEFAVKDAGDVRVLESGMAPRDDGERGGKTRTIYYAKHGRTETTGKLDVELVPRTANGKEFTLIYFGSPAPKIELTVIAPSKWEKKLTTDDQGRVTLPMPWAGRYVLEVVHYDNKPGSWENQPFDRTRHISTLSFIEPKGMRWVDGR